VGRFALWTGNHFFGGGVASEILWTKKSSRATKFEGRLGAETAALMIATEQPWTIGILEVVDLDEWERQNAKHG
jgi:hypothetical protein